MPPRGRGGDGGGSGRRPSAGCSGVWPVSRSTVGPEPVGHLVQRGRGDDEQAEEAEQEQQRHGAVDGDGRLERAGGEEADDAAGGAHAVGALGRGGDAGGDVGEAARGEGEGRGADGGAGGGGVLLRGAQHPDAEGEQHERDGVADLAEGAGDDGVDDGADGSRHPPPLAGGDDDGEGDEQEADAVAAVLGLEVAAGVAHLAGDGAGGVRQAHPGALDGAQRERQPAGAGPARPVRERAAGRRVAGRVEVLRPRAEEDVRVAMVAGYATVTQDSRVTRGTAVTLRRGVGGG